MEGNQRRDDVYSKAVKAGKRTYFFDVKATRADDYYLTITESKKKWNDEGRYYYEKHKLFLYKEDFDKFSEGLQEVVDFIRREKGSEPIKPPYTPRYDRHHHSQESRSSETHSTKAPETEQPVTQDDPVTESNVSEDQAESGDSSFTVNEFEDLDTGDDTSGDGEASEATSEDQ